MKFSLLTRLYRRHRISDIEQKKDEIVRRANIIERAENSEFFTMLMDEIAVLHEQYLSASQGSLWHAGGAFALLDLTKRLKAIKSQRDTIMAEAQQRASQNEEQEQFAEQEAGGNPLTI